MYRDTEIAAATRIVTSETTRVQSKLDIETALRIAMRARHEGRIDALEIEMKLQDAEIDDAMRIVNSEVTCLLSKLNIETALRIAMRARCEGRIDALLPTHADRDEPGPDASDSSILSRRARTRKASASCSLSESLPGAL
jgi:hypothetical protein